MIEARRPARLAGGELITIDEQDRRVWNGALIGEGHALVRERLKSGALPGRYQILAAINAVHTSALDFRDTDWRQILALYDQLVALDPSPIVALNRAIALGEVESPQTALASIDYLEGTLNAYHPFHAARADLLRRLGKIQEARQAYERAIGLSGNTAESAALRRRRDRLVDRT
jgi:RNA polymerase sigma-70 factor (ECF subfamily)